MLLVVAWSIEMVHPFWWDSVRGAAIVETSLMKWGQKLSMFRKGFNSLRFDDGSMLLIVEIFVGSWISTSCDSTWPENVIFSAANMHFFVNL